jgi:ribosome-binding factor A
MAIQEVELTPDLSIAKVQVRLMFGGEGPEARAGAMQALFAVVPGLRASLSPILRMRHVPELRFTYDEGADHRARIDDVLEEIKREDAEKRRTLGADSDE